MIEEFLFHLPPTSIPIHPIYHFPPPPLNRVRSLAMTQRTLNTAL